MSNSQLSALSPAPVQDLNLELTTSGSSSSFHRSSPSSSISSIVPARAERARRASAASHNLLSLASMSSFPQILAPSGPSRPTVRVNPDHITHAESEGDEHQQQDLNQPLPAAPGIHLAPGDRTSQGSARTQLVAALARLPWAEPPPRISPSSSLHSVPPSPSGQPVSSPIPTGTISSDLRDVGRTPTYSFLESDPAIQISPVNPTLSRQSSRTSSLSSPYTPTFPVSTQNLTALGSPLEVVEGGRRSSYQSGMAEASQTPHSTPSTNVIRPISPAPSLPLTTMGGHSDESIVRSLSAAIRRLSRQSIKSGYARSTKTTTSATSRSRSTKSTKSTNSGRSRRVSTSTLSHRFGGRQWELDEGGVPLVGYTYKGKGKESASAESDMQEVDEDGWEIVKKREETMDLLTLVGRAAVLERMLRAGRRVSNTTIRQHRQSLTSLHRRLTQSFHPSHPSQTTGIAVRGSMSSTRHSGQATPRTSHSLRQRLSKRIKRDKSTTDEFTELGSDDGEGSGTENDHLQRSRSKRQTASQSNERSVRARASIVNNGVIVFPERPPALPQKPKRSPEAGLNCATIMCVAPTSPSVNPDLSDIEKSMGLPQSPIAEDDQHEDRGRPEGWTAQSPHLGHRSPDWRRRQSVMSYLSTGQWSYTEKKRWGWTIGIGAAIMCVAIVGLLGGLLSRRGS